MPGPLEQVAMLSHADLYRMRRATGADQASLGPLEHRAFAREFTQENPVLAPLSLAVAIPAYTAAKALGFTNARSPASFSEITQGYKGIAEGLAQTARNLLSGAPE